MCYGVSTVIDAGIRKATFTNEDYPRGWHQREGTRSFVLERLFALICSLHFHFNFSVSQWIMLFKMWYKG